MADNLAKLRDRKLRKVLDRLPATRSCDGCDLCCTAVGVRELDKPPAVACKHLCGEAGASCGIYDRRPRSCREFYCLWRVLSEGVPAEFRPADCGFVLSVNDVHAHPVVITAHPDPARPNAWDTLPARRLFHDMADRGNCLVVVGQGALAHTIFGPQGYVFTKDAAPELFINGGEQVGAPDFIFRKSDKPVAMSREVNPRGIAGNQWKFDA
jgi:uncharacterized cysteine cluster protein YcgN (CxxCxxCC family)